MKFLIPALVLIGIIFVFVAGILYAQVKLSNDSISLPKPAPAEPPATIPTPTGTISAPTDFHGPTAQPHIIGPSANPPNY